MTTLTIAKPRTRPLISWRVRKLLIGYSYLVPAALCMLATVVVPIILAIKMSLYADVLYKPQDYRFIGLGNYVRLIEDPVFWLTLWNSVIWVFGSVIVQFLFGFAAALLLQQAFRGRALVRTLTLLPWIIPGVVVGLIWQWLYQPNYGVINDLLIRAGWMHERLAWLSSPDTAMGAVVFTNVWRGIPFFAIMLLAGLQSVPDELYEAAHVDGAGVFSRFWHITLPLLRPIIVVATATRIIWTFNYADLIFVMTGGGPANATQITSTYTLLQAYSSLDFGYAGALSVVLLLVMLSFTFVLPARHQRRRGNRMTPRHAPKDFAERLLAGPVVWIGLVLLTAFALGPFLWMLLTSLKDRTELYATPLQYLPVHPTFENYVDAWTSPVTPFSRFFLNSLWVCSVTMVATTFVSVLAGYAIARFRFAGRDALLLIFLATQMFPSVLLIAPLLTQWRALGLIDTYQALIYSNFSFTVPFTVWMMVGYFSSIPRDLEESAMIDGCNHFGALVRIVLPLAAPGIAATAIFAFVVSWSELLFAISFTTETSMRTLSAGLLYMVGQYEVQWGPLSAGVILSTVPVAVLFSFLQRHLIHGLTAGAVKG